MIIDDKNDEEITSPFDTLPSDALDEAIAAHAEEEPEPEPEPDEKKATEAPEPEKEPSEEKTEEPDKDEGPKAKTEAELEAELEQIQPSKHAHEGTKTGFKTLKDKIKERNLAALAAEKRAQEVEAKLQERDKQPLPEELAKELEQLRQFRRVKDIENDPSFKTKYDARIAKLSEETLGIIEKGLTSPLPEATKEYIARKGGIEAVRVSTERTANGGTVAEWFKDSILDSMTPKGREDFEDNIREARQLQRQREREIQEVQQDGEKWEKQKEEEQKAQQADYEARATKIRDNMIKTMGPLAQYWEPKEDATAEEKEYAVWHNKTLDESAKLYASVVGKTDPDIDIPKSLAAGQAFYLNALTQRLQKENADLKKQLETASGRADKLKNAGRTAKSSNAPVSQAEKPKPANLNASFDAIAAEIFAQQDKEGIK